MLNITASCAADIGVLSVRSSAAPLQHATPSPIPINSQFMIINRHAGNNSLLKNNQASGWGAENEWVSGWWV
jgi:hypothetical protein